MPVPTETFWNIKKLNVVFAASAVILLGSFLLLIKEDQNVAWRGYQKDARVWDAAMTTDAIKYALSASDKAELEKIKTDIAQIGGELEKDEKLKELNKKKADIEAGINIATMPAATIKGQITPLSQLVEKATLEFGADHAKTKKLMAELNAAKQKSDKEEATLAALDRQLIETNSAIEKEKSRLSALTKSRDDKLRRLNSLEERLAKVNPTGAAWLGEQIRNAPLQDWFNPSLAVQQVVVPDVRTDFNFLTTETIDRCSTCHVNIDNPRFEEKEIVSFAERQVAMGDGQDVATIDPHKPVVMLGFWVNAAKLRVASDAYGMPALAKGVEALKAAALDRVKELRAKAGMSPLADNADVVAEIESLLKQGESRDKEEKIAVTRAEWYAPAAYFLTDLKGLLEKQLSKGEYRELRDLYRQELIGSYNHLRTNSSQGLPALSANPVLMAHPRLDLYADADSKHPMKSMGCTVCHEGSGQETEFKHTAHTPREVWVDEKTGSPVPAFLIRPAEPKVPVAMTVSAAQVHEAPRATAVKEGETGEHGFTFDDLNLANPNNPKPFAPDSGHIEETAAYVSPAAARGEKPRGVVRQEAYWTKAYHWEQVHYMHWEKPMNSQEFIESSCNKCHTQVFDLKESAPRLFEGRKLFAQLGCANCHAVDAVKDHLDVKKVGPSLVHVKEKLSPTMMSSWIWAPKAFRPMSRMPHYFMLENNSTPVDILRTRTEVAAITHYLQHSTPAEGTPEYKPEPPPSTPGDAKAGRAVFNSVGCLACHTNMAESGEKWIAEDLIKRTGVSADEAKKQYDAMGYNQRHWYALEHIPEKLTIVGPELSGVGTKLKAGRTVDQARAWVYDWVRNPRHYSSYTIMPSLRLSEQEANDLSAYLLAQERPDYTPVDFTNLDGDGKAMLNQIVGALPDPAGKVSLQSTQDEKLEYVGRKMIANYGCNGCHLINGFENAASACAELNEWGLKDPHKLDFGYFDHAYTAERKNRIEVWKVAHEGLASDAPHVNYHSAEAPEGKPAELRKVAIQWEEMDLERRPWLYNKLHNTRIYDRGRKLFDSTQDTPEKVAEAVKAGSIDLGRPYDKIKMPKFFLADDQVKALVTFVTSVRKPLVSDTIQHKTYSESRLRVARGRQVATVLNCYGCHNIEGNEVAIHKYLDVFSEDGSEDMAKLNAAAPPRLVGQGSRTQPDWLHYFLRSPFPLRPWLKVRMPSFPFHDEHGSLLVSGAVDYFAGASQVMADEISPWVTQIETYRATNKDDADWYKASALAKPTDQLAAFMVKDDLNHARDFDPRQATQEDLRTTWEGVLKSAQFLTKLNHVEYPFPVTPRPNPDPERFARGKALYSELKCYQCHALGDESQLLASWKATYGESAAKAAPAPAEPEDAGYGEEPAKTGGDEGYGEEAPAAAPKPTGPVYTAPNLANVGRRLQWNWVNNWFQNPATIQPGTSMPQWFPDGVSAFDKYPPEQKDRLHSMYGYTGKDQIAVLMDFVYAAGLRNYTYFPPDWKAPVGGAAEAPVEIKPMAAPPAAKPTEEKKAEPAAKVPTEPSATPAATPTPAATAPPAEVRTEPDHSTIVLNDGKAPFEGTRVVGLVKYDGKLPRRTIIRMDADARCMAQHKTRPVGQDLIVNPDKTLQNAFIYVSQGLEGKIDAKPTNKAELDQSGCLFLPHVQGVVVNQELLIQNNDPTMHNVHMTSQKNGTFNMSMPAPGMKDVKKFGKPEMGVLFKCDVHPWMQAYLYVMPHPFFAVSDVEGRFEIKGLPPGQYQLTAIHEDKAIPPVTFAVTVEANTSVRSDVTLVQK
ncbi:MAG: c-type cytochrome [Planctomycetes bacterium]|nr:c-type cytochrome [Planctomycetota bacterium]